MSFVNYFNKFSFKLKFSVVFACLVGIILISYAFFSVFFKSKNYELEYVNNLLNFKSYIAKYEVTIFSNKTECKYVINEKYKKVDENELFRFEHKDFLDSNYIVIINGDKYRLENENQIARYISNRKNYEGINIYSLSTYIKMINSGAFQKEEIKEEVTLKYIMYLKEILNKDESMKFEDILSNRKDIEKVEIIFSKEKPISIRIFDENGEKIAIKYLYFEKDSNIDESEFEV